MRGVGGWRLGGSLSAVFQDCHGVPTYRDAGGETLSKKWGLAKKWVSETATNEAFWVRKCMD